MATIEQIQKYKFDKWMDNTDLDNLGIVKWATDMLPQYVFNDTPDFHKEIYKAILELYDPVYTDRLQRQLNLISFRGSAKSTAANTVLVAYLVANNGRKMRINTYTGKRWVLLEERYILIVSEVATQAETFVTRVRDLFDDSEEIKAWYKVQIQKTKTEKGKWTRADFTINNVRVRGIGTKQKVRGTAAGYSRPTLVISDDIYSEENIKTEDGRANVRSWYEDALLNSIDDLTGKVISLGTILHEDTILVDNKRSNQWRSLEFAAMDVSMFNTAIQEFITEDPYNGQHLLPFEEPGQEINAQLIVRQKAYFEKIQQQRDFGIAWPQRQSLHFFLNKAREAMNKGKLSGLYQEYFHVTRAPSEFKFKEDAFKRINGKIVRDDNETWIQFTDPRGVEHTRYLNIEIGVDLASGQAMDYGSQVVLGGDIYRNIYILQIVNRRMPLRDGGKDPDNYGKVELDVSKVQAKGQIDELFRLANTWKPKRVKIGHSGMETTIVEDARQIFKMNHSYATIFGRAQHSNDESKIDRIINTLSNYYDTGSAYANCDDRVLRYQLQYIGTTKNDDIADALEVAAYHFNFPGSDKPLRINDEEIDSADNFVLADYWRLI